MAFVMAVNNLIEAMKKPGCPICRINRQASVRALESFLWENVNEPDVRQGILDSYGFCPTHVRVMVAREISSSSVPLGTNIIYEHLGRVVASQLRALMAPRLNLSPANYSFSIVKCIRSFISRFFPHNLRVTSLLQPRGMCPACKVGGQAAMNSLHVLCEELHNGSDVVEIYLDSPGLCLPHLLLAVDTHRVSFPHAVNLLIETSASRLENQSQNMKEYLRKNNWTYRDEKLTEAEDTAWRKTLGFFTGFPETTFTHKMENFD